MTHDIIIVGGGMAGLTFACALAQQTSLSIAILEAEAKQSAWQHAEYHYRVSAISLASQRIFSALGVWNTIYQSRVSPFTNMHVWDALNRAQIKFTSHDIAELQLGFIIENNLIQSALMEKVKHYPQIDFISPVKLKDFHQSENGVELISEDGKVFRSQLAVAADGAQSWLRDAGGIQVTKEDYAQKAIVATVKTKLAHEKTARQVFLDTGPLAFLPLAEGNVLSIVWSLDADAANKMQSLTDAEFKRALTDAFSSQLGEVIDISKRYSFPLHKQKATHYINNRTVLIGDAAHTVHPLAGQGVNIGLLDAACLAEVLIEAFKNKRNFASLSTLRKYERWRRADNLPMLAGIDMLKKLFASEKKSLHELRALGLNTTNRWQWLKNLFIHYAVGNRSGLPMLAMQYLNSD